MGFKDDIEFLQNISMGAIGVLKTMAYLSSNGFEPIELERFATSNKVWATKVKRLRLPDILCVKTGLRVEVRAKGKLQIAMSDTPTNNDRLWDAGLRDHDLAAFLAFRKIGLGKFEVLCNPICFSIASLRESVNMSSLSSRKAVSEGAELTRIWKSTVPTKSGKILEITEDKIKTEWHLGDGKTRKWTYRLEGKKSYFSAGEYFEGESSFLSGAPDPPINIQTFLNQDYDPLNDLSSNLPFDRYAAVKALRFRKDILNSSKPAILKALEIESEERVLLETAASGIALGLHEAQECLLSFIYEREREDLKMEAVFILTELKNQFSEEELFKIAQDKDKVFSKSELRPAAVWGLGKAGTKSYDKLLQFIDDENPDVATHAITGFDKDVPTVTIDHLVSLLLCGSRRTAAAASEVLRIIGTEHVITSLLSASNNTSEFSEWVIATLGRISNVSNYLSESDYVYKFIRPLIILSEDENWLTHEIEAEKIRLLLKQNIF